MKKYKFNLLSIEITRRCNKKCAHCANGDAQNITISTDIIDKVFDDVENVRRVHFGGGEPLLHIELIEYFINKLITSSWTTKMVEVTTNGTICDSKIVDAFESFCTRTPGTYADLRISNDQFHDAEEYEQAYSFYKPLVDKANSRIWQHSGSGGIFLHYSGDLQPLQTLHYEGRAVELIDSFTSQYQHGHNVNYQLHMKHRINILDGIITRRMEILANGNICVCEEVAFTQRDNISFGNIMQDTITNLVDNHNCECLILRREAQRIQNAEYSQHLPLTSPLVKLDEIICRQVLALREKVKAMFPYLPAQDIISEFPFPDEDETVKIFLSSQMRMPINPESPIPRTIFYTHQCSSDCKN